MGVQFIPPRRRAAIETEIEMHLARVERLVARLDRADSPSDDMEDDDPSGDPIDQKGECWSDDGRGVHRTLPLYGLDQTRGPVNHREADRERYAIEAGLVRTPAGGGCHAN